jgi:chemotaxis signal transduction protein
MTAQRINWTEVRAKLRASEAALEEAMAVSAIRTQEVFRKRALRLAQAGVESAPAKASIPALTFKLNAERYAIRLSDLTEVLPFTHCTPVPGSSREFLGVINRHGELRPVLDLAHIMLPARELPAGGFLLMLRRQGRQIGLRVDHVEGVHEIPGEDADNLWQGQYTTRISGRMSGEALLLLDPERILAVQR